MAETFSRVVPPYRLAAGALYSVSSERFGAEQAKRVAGAETAGLARRFAPARAAAVAVFGEGGVPAQACDHREDVLAVGVDAHPAARPAATPAHEAGRVERGFEQAGGVQHVA